MQARLEHLEKNNEILLTKQTELLKKVDELSSSHAVLQDRVETLQLAQERRAAAPAPVPVDSKRKPRQVRNEEWVGDSQAGDEPFLITNDPRDRKLPPIKLTNEDLTRLDRGSQPELPKTVQERKENPDASKLYNAAFAQFQAQNYKDTISMMESFLAQFPKHEYSDNALFWMGESYFRLGDFSKALEHFERVGREYPSGNKVPDALLRAGACYLRLSQNEPARLAFQKIVTTYPQSDAAVKARTLMAELSKNQPQGRM